jgi:N-acetylneuraminic acid mutarotase
MPGSAVAASWAERAPTPNQRASEHAVTVDGGRLYALGGFGGQRSLLRYDRGANAWSALPNLPAGRDHLAAFAIDGGVYMIGGSANGSGDQSTSAFRFDLGSQTWEARPELAWMYGSHAAVLHGNAYIGDVDGSLQQYAPRARSVRRIAPPDFTPRDHSQVVAFLDEIWVIAGRGAETSSVAIFDPVSERWRAGPSIAAPRGGFAAAAVGDRIVIGGGEVIFSGVYIEPTVEIYNAGAVGWQYGPDLPVPVHGVAAGAVDGRIVLVSGSTQAGLTTGATGRVFELTLPP